MSTLRKLLLAAFLAAILAVILLTWGSIGSAVLTLALLIGIGALLLQRFTDTHEADDFRWEE